MQIEERKIPVRELVAGYINDDERGVYGYNGQLNIRPPYQREFIYEGQRECDVIDTILKGFPLNIMYWAVCNDGSYEIIDGQQRTISICRFVDSRFHIDDAVRYGTEKEKGRYYYFHNLTPEEQETILNYEIDVYFCTGTERERLDWFERVNIIGVRLSKQELRNAVFHGTWLEDAKKYFSKPRCKADEKGKFYMNKSAIRQEYLETALSWISNGNITKYMSEHQYDDNAQELWDYFEGVIRWIQNTFPQVRKEMKSVDWGWLYREYHDAVLDPGELESEIKELFEDEDVSKKAGIYPYVLTRDQKYLNIRAFPPKIKSMVYEKQNGICASCGDYFGLKEMEADHIIPWIEGGKTDLNNCQMLCRTCNRRKGRR